MNKIYLSHSTQVAEGNFFRKHTVDGEIVSKIFLDLKKIDF